MKILLCTFSFSQIAHGPAKFANLILDINKSYPEHTIKILTEDIDASTDEVYKMDFDIPRIVHGIQDFLRGYYYHKKALEIRKEYPYDVIIYNHALQAYWSALRMPKTIKVAGMLNDSNHVRKIFIKTGNPFRKRIIHTFLRWSEKFVVKNAHLIITPSKGLQNEIRQTYKVSDKNKVEYLYQSIESDKVNFHTKRFKEDWIQVVFVKSDYKIGGLDLLTTALSLLEDKWFRLVIIGPNLGIKEKVLSTLKAGKNTTIQYMGVQSQESVFKYMESSDILCIPSRREALGVANIEGLASGIPVVTTSTIGSVEVLDNGQNGWLANSDDVEDLADKLLECINSPEERLKKSTQGRLFVDKSFTHRKMVTSLVSILTQLHFRNNST